MAAVLEHLSVHDDGNDLVHYLDMLGARGWMGPVVGAALRTALGEAETAFRKSVTPQQARAQIVGDANLPH
jgi:hypothetical protein